VDALHHQFRAVCRDMLDGRDREGVLPGVLHDARLVFHSPAKARSPQDQPAAVLKDVAVSPGSQEWARRVNHAWASHVASSCRRSALHTNSTTVRRATSSSKRDASRLSCRFHANQATVSVTICAVTAMSGSDLRCPAAARPPGWPRGWSPRPRLRRPKYNASSGGRSGAQASMTDNTLRSRSIVEYCSDTTATSSALTSGGVSTPAAALSTGVVA